MACKICNGGTHDLEQQMQTKNLRSSLRNHDVIRLTKEIEAGLPYQALRDFQRQSALPLATVREVLQNPPRTLAPRKITGKLTSLESERLLRLARLHEQALELFERDTIAANTWLTTRSKALGNYTPLDMAKTEMGARAVEDFIGRLEHGVLS